MGDVGYCRELKCPLRNKTWKFFQTVVAGKTAAVKSSDFCHGTEVICGLVWSFSLNTGHSYSSGESDQR